MHKCHHIVHTHCLLCFINLVFTFNNFYFQLQLTYDIILVSSVKPSEQTLYNLLSDHPKDKSHTPPTPALPKAGSLHPTG